MMYDIATQALRDTALFKHLSDDHLALISVLTETRVLGRNEFVFHEGDEGDGFYIIIEGRIRISRQISGMGEEALTILDPGNYFGEMALIDDQSRSADAIVQERAKLIVLKKRDLQDLMFINRDIAYEFLWAFVRTLSCRLRETSDKLTFLTVSSKFG
jgi:CRP-like cAMP-binding protein